MRKPWPGQMIKKTWFILQILKLGSHSADIAPTVGLVKLTLRTINYSTWNPARYMYQFSAV